MAPSIDLQVVTLTKINFAREALGQQPLDKLPQGQRSHGQDCIIARGLHGDGYVVSVSQGATTFSNVTRPGFEKAMEAIAESWGVEITTTKTVDGRLATATLPNAPEMHEFVERFDAGQYPDLETGKAA